jgi:lipopolysaccharide/colanic/teichoic acid biosynthesis glycosyltransferase
MEVVVGGVDVAEQERLNDKRRVNKYLESVNERLPIGGTFEARVESARARKRAMLDRYPRPFNKMIYGVDYLLHRVWPKLPYARALYFALTKGRGRVMSEMEVIGRLYACGFRMMRTSAEGNEIRFLVEKVGEPAYDMEATYGPLIRLRRVGRNGSIIKVYKFRTMSPYSEYIQAYIFERNGYDGGTGFRDDTRITTVGAFMRKYWLDELPMLWNLLNGGLKLFGVRPVSRQYLSMFPEDFQAYRKRFKPGLIPPIVVNPPKTFDEIWMCEKTYLEEYERRPYTTDLRYFFKAVYNIVIKRVRSA